MFNKSEEILNTIREIKKIKNDKNIINTAKIKKIKNLINTKYFSKEKQIKATLPLKGKGK